MASQVAVAEVAVVPTFKGFRKQVTTETDGSAKTASTGFARIFSKTGTDSGKKVGTGFKSAFDQSAKGTSDKVVKSLEANVAKASRAMSGARLKEQDAIGKVRVAQAQLNEANKKYARDSSQVIRAQERLETSSRQLKTAHEATEHATDDLKKAQGELARAADRAGDELSDAGNNGVKGFRSNVVGGVKSFAGPLIAAFAALGIGTIVADAFREAKDFVLDSIGKASELEQSVGGVDAVFKDSATSIHKWAEEADQAVGLSKNSFNELSTLIGAQLKNMGTPMDELAGQTNGLVELGADLAAQFGGSTSEAVEALSSLLRGESNPIEKYGVSINQTAIKAEALALGLGDVTQDTDKVAGAQIRAEVAQRKYNDALDKFGENSTQALSAEAALLSANSSLESALEGSTAELTLQQKAQATLSLLTKQTSDAQGAFGREADTLAGKQQRAAAAWEDVSTSMGEAFMPVAAEVADILNKDLIPMIAKIVEEEGPGLAQSFSDMLPSLTELAKELLPLLPDAIDAVVQAAPAMISMLELITPLLLWMTQATGDQNTMLSGLFGLISGDKSLEGFAEKMWNMSGPFGEVFRWGTELLSGFTAWFQAIPAEVETGLNNTVAWLEGLPDRALEALGDLGESLVQSGKDLMNGFIRGIQESPVGAAVSSSLDWVRGFFPNSPAKRGPFSGSGWSGIKKSGGALFEQFVDGFGGDEPQFPDFPGAGPGGSGGAVPGGAGAGSSSRGGVTQINNYAPERPEVAAALARDQMDSLLRST